MFFVGQSLNPPSKSNALNELLMKFGFIFICKTRQKTFKSLLHAAQHRNQAPVVLFKPENVRQ